MHINSEVENPRGCDENIMYLSFGAGELTTKTKSILISTRAKNNNPNKAIDFSFGAGELTMGTKSILISTRAKQSNPNNTVDLVIRGRKNAFIEESGSLKMHL